MGIGPLAEQRAGVQYAEGRLYYFFIRSNKFLEWYDKFMEAEKAKEK